MVPDPGVDGRERKCVCVVEVWKIRSADVAVNARKILESSRRKQDEFEKKSEKKFEKKSEKKFEQHYGKPWHGRK